MVSRSGFLVILMSFLCIHAWCQNQWYPYQSANGDWFFVNENKERLNQQPFDSVQPFYREQAFVQRNGKWGVIDQEGNTVIPIDYQSVQFVNNYTRQFYLLGKRNGDNALWKWGVSNKSGEEVLPVTFEHIELLLRNRMNFSKPACFVASLHDSVDSKGLYDLNGNKLLEHVYEKAVPMPTDRYSYDRDFCIVLMKKDKNRNTAGMYNVTVQKWVFPCTYTAEYVIDEWSNVRVHFNRRLWRVPLTPNPFVFVYDGLNNLGKQVYHYYSIKGDFLLEADYPRLEEGQFEFIYNDSLIASSKVGTYELISEDPEVYHLVIEDSAGLISTAIFSPENGMIVPSGIFQYNRNLQVIKGSFYLKRLDDGSTHEVTLDGRITKVERKTKPNHVHSDWQKRTTSHGSYRYNRKKKRIIVYDREGKRVQNIKGRYINGIDDPYEQFVYSEQGKTFSLYNLRTQRFVFKKEQKLNAELLDSLDDTPIYVHYLNINASPVRPTIQRFVNETGWAFYDENGQLMKQAPTRTLRLMFPIEINGTLGGMIWFDQRKGGSFSDYELFSGIRLGDLDSVYTIQQDPETNEYYTYDVHSIYRGYDEQGNELFAFRNLHAFQNGYARVETLDGGFNLCDSTYQLQFDRQFTRLDFKGNDLLVGTRDSLYHFISLKEKPEMGKGYTYFQRALNALYVCTNPDGSLDALNLEGELLYENCDSIEWEKGYFVVRSKKIEYWLTPKGVVYGSHAITQN